MFSIISDVMTWLAALTGLFFGYKSWRNSKMDAVKQFMEAENSEELFEARHNIYSLYHAGEKINSDNLYATKIASHYHFWGLMTKRGYLPKWVFSGEPGESAVELYKMLEEYIHIRQKTKNKYAENFIWLINHINP